MATVRICIMANASKAASEPKKWSEDSIEATAAKLKDLLTPANLLGTVSNRARRPTASKARKEARRK